MQQTIRIFTGEMIAQLMQEPATLAEQPDGKVLLSKAGISATGPSRLDATAEWGRRFAELIRQPARSE